MIPSTLQGAPCRLKYHPLRHFTQKAQKRIKWKNKMKRKRSMSTQPYRIIYPPTPSLKNQISSLHALGRPFANLIPQYIFLVGLTRAL